MLGKYRSNPKIYFVVTSIVIVVALQIAWQTRYRAHPDEITHGNAFCYFETHTWLPNLNSDEVYHDPYGWSRAYDPEIVYWLYGRLGGLLRPHVEPILRTVKPKQFNSPGCEPAIEIYRWFNVGLYAAAVGLVFLAARRNIWLISIAAVLLSIPQVVYVYSYANDDAWGTSSSIFLFLYIHSRSEMPRLTLRDMIYLGILTGLVLLSKRSFWVSIPFAYVLLLPRTLSVLTTKNFSRRDAAKRLGVLVAAGLIVVAPWHLIYPLTQGNFAAKAEQTLEQRARSDLKPSAMTAPGHRLAAQGVPFQAILLDAAWLKSSAQSFYGLFGYFTVILPSELYRVAAGIMLLLLAINYFATARLWQTLSAQMRWLLILAPVSLALNILASLYNSWMYDYQPQGRYLFASLIPLAIMLGGTMDSEPGKARWLRTILWALLYGLCLYVLWTQVVQNLVLR